MNVHHATVTVVAGSIEEVAVALMQAGTELATVGAPERAYTVSTPVADITVNVTRAESDRYYSCAECGGLFEKNPEWTDADAEAEALAVGFDLDDDCVMVCHDCYVRLMAVSEPSRQAWQRITALFTGDPDAEPF
jgi:hypothetical protein